MKPPATTTWATLGALNEVRVRRAQRPAVQCVELATRLPRPPEPPTYPPELGGCVDCGHTRLVHTRGRDTVEHCHAQTCPCARWKPLRQWGTYIRAVAVVVGVPVLLIAAMAFLFVVFATLAAHPQLIPPVVFGLGVAAAAVASGVWVHRGRPGR